MKPDGAPPAILMRIETDATYSKDSGTKGIEKADSLDETLPANKMETEDMNINKASASTAKKSLCKAEDPKMLSLPAL